MSFLCFSFHADSLQLVTYKKVKTMSNPASSFNNARLLSYTSEHPHNKIAQQNVVGIQKDNDTDHFYNMFYRLFDVVHTDTPELKEQSHRLRYQVFCCEKEGYENPDDHPDGMETDRYDERADSVLLVYKPQNISIGTLRVIKPDPDDPYNSFPIQSLCDIADLENKQRIMSSCEFSRFCISKELRLFIWEDVQRNKDSLFTEKEDILSPEQKDKVLKQALSSASIGLVRGGMEIMNKNNTSNNYCLMEEHKAANLIKQGVAFKPIGSEIEHHGKRIPLYSNIIETCEMIMQNTAIWNIMTDKGRIYRDALNTDNSTSDIGAVPLNCYEEACM